MSKVQVIQPKYQSKSTLQQTQMRTVKNPSFTGEFPTLEETVAKYGRETIEAKIGIKGSISRITQLLQKHKGELLSQGINGACTFFLSPIFIAFNPFSKEDEKTQQYTALRQPISAINTVLVSVPLTMLLNNHTEKIASKGYIKSIDLRSCPDKNYLGRVFRSEYKKVKNESNAKIEEFLNTFSTLEDRAKVEHDMKLLYPDLQGEKLAKQVHKGIIELYIKKKQKEATAFYTELMYKDPNVLRNNADIKNKVENLDDYLKENNLHEVDFQDFMRNNFKIDFIKEKIKENGKNKISYELKEEAFLEKIKEIKASDFLRKIGLVACEISDDGKYTTDKFSEEKLRKFLSIRREEPVIQTYMKTRTISRNAIEEEIHAMGKMLARHMQYTVDGKIISDESLTLEQMLEPLKIKPEEFIEDVKTKKVAFVVEKFAKKLEGLEGLVGLETKDVATQLMKIRTKIFNSKFGGLKQYVGIFFNLGIVAVTCTTLNWVYPRIIEKLFPSLLKHEEEMGGNK